MPTPTTLTKTTAADPNVLATFATPIKKVTVCNLESAAAKVARILVYRSEDGGDYSVLERTVPAGRDGVFEEPRGIVKIAAYGDSGQLPSVAIIVNTEGMSHAG